MDISLIQYPSYGRSKYWMLLADEATSRCWSSFLKAKRDLKDQLSHGSEPFGKTKEFKSKY